MPTTKQLYDIWDSELELFGGHGLPRDSYQNLDGGHGLTEPRYMNEPQNSTSREIEEENSSEDVIGTLHYNSDKQSLELNLDESKD